MRAACVLVLGTTCAVGVSSVLSRTDMVVRGHGQMVVDVERGF